VCDLEATEMSSIFKFISRSAATAAFGNDVSHFRGSRPTVSLLFCIFLV
jgi:hypothetical protein